MSADFIRWVQQRLVAHGFRLAVDGFAGSRSAAALKGFQLRQHLKVTGTTTPETVVALRHTPDGDVVVPARVEVLPPWLAELQRRMGLHEVRDRGALMAWLRSDGRTLGDPAKLPWCGDAVQTAIALTLPHEPQVANPFLARNWLAFGKHTAPRVGAVMVFDGGSRPAPAGHVALYVGEDATHYTVLGGNQSNAITETRVARHRRLGARWPLTFDLDTAAVALAANGAAPISINEA